VQGNTWKAKFVLKGISLAFVTILLMFSGFFISELDFLSKAFASVHFSLSLSAPALVTESSPPISELRAGDPYIIQTTGTNQEAYNMSIVTITQVTDSEGVAESIGIVKAVATASSSFNVGVMWIPLHSGNYKLKTFALSDLEAPVILAFPNETSVTVNKSPKSTQNTPLPELRVIVGSISGSVRDSPLFIRVNVTDVQGNPVGDAAVSATVINSSGYGRTFHGVTISAGIWTFAWELPNNYTERLNVHAKASKAGYEEGITDELINSSP